MQPQPDKKAVALLYDNLANLKHPHGWIKHPYFDDRFCADPDGVREVKRRFAEAVVMLFEENDLLKKSPGRPRKDDAA